MTNAPGHRPFQQVAGRIDFLLTDDDWYLDEAQERLCDDNHDSPVLLGPINGFLMAAKTTTWAKFADRDGCVFSTDKQYKMTRNEDELIGRFHRAKLKVGAVPSSFVFHYRGVTRPQGRRGKEAKGMYRPKV